MSGHSIVAPSGASCWVECALYPTISAMFPDVEQSESSADGVATHEVGARMVHSFTRHRLGYPTPGETIGAPASNGVIITGEMFDAAEMYAADVFAVMQKTGVFGENLHVEELLPIPYVHEMCFGTPDSWLFDPATCTVYLWDFKFGHRVVEVFECWQLICYYAGILYRLASMRPGMADQHLRVVMRVVQPRAHHSDGPVREWSVMGSDLRGHINTLQHAALEVFSPNPRAKAGEWCRDCNGAWSCDTLKRAGYGALDYIGRGVQPLTPDQLGLELHYARKLYAIAKARHDALQAEAEALARKGARIPFSMLEPVKGRRTWSKPLDEVFALGDILNKDLRKVSAITPTQAMKLGIDAAVVNAYSDHQATGVKLVPDDGSKAKKVFSNGA